HKGTSCTAAMSSNSSRSPPSPDIPSSQTSSRHTPAIPPTASCLGPRHPPSEPSCPPPPSPRTHRPRQSLRILPRYRQLPRAQRVHHRPGVAGAHHHRPLSLIARHLAPVHAHHNALLCTLQRPFTLRNRQPRRARLHRIIHRRLPAIEQRQRARLLCHRINRSQRKSESPARARQPRIPRVDAQRPRLRHLHPAHRRHHIHRRIAPCHVSDVRLVHHVIPLAVQQCVVILVAQRRVARKHSLHRGRLIICLRIPEPRIQRIAPGGDVHLRQIRACIDRILD